MTQILKSGLLWSCLLMLAGSALLYSTAPLSEKSGIWTHAVLRNWAEYGWRNLGGRMVTNPGGVAVREQPEVYTGHRAGTLNLAYFAGMVVGNPGQNGLPFYLLLTSMVALSVWLVLGRDHLALLTACAVALSPGYLRTTQILDPLTIPVMLGIPVMFWASTLLGVEKITPLRCAGLFALVAGYAAFNWTTAFSFAIILGFLVVSLRHRLQRWILFAIIAGIAVGVVGVVSVLDKQRGGAGLGPSWAFFYNNYLFGPGGYHAYPMDWRKATLRIAAANLVGLLPLFALYGWSYYRALRTNASGVSMSLAPLMVAILTIGGMRNYFAHHPWMAAPVLIFGIVFSLRLLPKAHATVAPAENLTLAKGSVLVSILAYGYFVLLFLRINSADEDSLVRFVRENTLRHDVIAYSKQDDWFAQDMSRLQEVLDRRMLSADEATKLPANLPIENTPRYYLTTSQDSHVGIPVARGECGGTPGPKAAVRLLEWYRNSIARRARGDRLEVTPTLYLYKIR